MVKPVKIVNNQLGSHLRKKLDYDPKFSFNQFALDKPLVSVIVPAYNAEAYILQTLNSVLSQTYKNIEVVVVDDGSHDKTAQIVESIMLRDNRVKLLRQQNSGVAAARNLAIEKSRGAFIAPIDADDIWYPSKIEKQVRCMLHAEPSLGLVYAWSIHIDEKGLPTGGFSASDVEGDVLVASIMSNFIGNASTPLIRRVCFERVGGYSSRFFEQDAQGCEDSDLYIRIAESYTFRVVKEFLVGYRKSIGSMSFNYRTLEKSYLILLGDVRRRYPDIPSFMYRWTISRHYLYFSHQSQLRAHYWASILYLCKAALMDIVLISYPEFYRFLRSNILRLIKEAVILAVRLGNRPLVRSFEEASHYREGVAISDIVIRSSQPPSGLAKLYRIRLQRIQQLLSKKKTVHQEKILPGINSIL